ncbi:MAG: hypothetical protein NTV38_13800 [Chloroflexi bacterium]|nr:hypothetical protein [Chloroflexota bacterium]
MGSNPARGAALTRTIRHITGNGEAGRGGRKNDNPALGEEPNYAEVLAAAQAAL